MTKTEQPIEKLIRLENGNIAAVSRRLGVSRETVYQWRRKPTKYAILAIEKALAEPAAS